EQDGGKVNMRATGSCRGVAMNISVELATLAGTGAQSLVSAMASDAWAEVKDRFARLLSRGEPRREAAQCDRLDRDREVVLAGGTGDVEAGWRVRLLDLLEDDPAAASGLRALLAETADLLRPGIEMTVVRQDIR